MGLFSCSKTDEYEIQAKQNHKRLTKEVELSKSRDARTMKVLLLGSGESGKSTIFKQTKLIHGSGYTKLERASYVHAIRANCIEFSQEILKGIIQLGNDNEDEIYFNKYSTLIEEANDEDEFDDELVIEAIKYLWNLPQTKEVLLRRNEFQIADSTEYFLNQIDRISQQYFTPSDDDILRCRVRTTGVAEYDFKFDEALFKFVDVGGQRNERRKWIHQFENVNALLFVASMSEYDQVLFEQATQNRMLESLSVFGEVCTLPTFKNTPIILFLNKRDLFEEKIKQKSLSIAFPDYTGSNDCLEAIEFVKNKFIKQAQVNRKSTVYTHVISATDTNSMRHVLLDIERHILEKTLSGSGVV